MKIICHRANINGSSTTENLPEQIIKCITLGFDVEIDIWNINNTWFLGHDEPMYKIELSFLKQYSNNLWIHCKNLSAFSLLLVYKNLNIFYHENDDYTLTSKKYIWTFPKPEYEVLYENQIILDFEPMNNDKYLYYKNSKIFGLCCDYVLT